MKQVHNYPISQALCEYLDSKGTHDITLRGTWIKGDMTDNAPMCELTTSMVTVRAWSVGSESLWTKEDWEHDNGYRCTLSLLTKAEFLALIRA